jgi:hypothetical protein
MVNNTIEGIKHKFGQIINVGSMSYNFALQGGGLQIARITTTPNEILQWPWHVESNFNGYRYTLLESNVSTGNGRKSIPDVRLEFG